MTIQISFTSIVKEELLVFPRAAVALAFSILGLFGAHHYYLKRTGWGILYTVTIGLLGTGGSHWSRTELASSGS